MSIPLVNLKRQYSEIQEPVRRPVPPPARRGRRGDDVGHERERARGGRGRGLRLLSIPAQHRCMAGGAGAHGGRCLYLGPLADHPVGLCVMTGRISQQSI